MRYPTPLLCLLLLGDATHAEIYKWRDASGQMVYSQTPPPPELQTEAETVAPPPPPPSAPAVKPPKAAPPQQEKAPEKPPQAKTPSPAEQAKKAETLAAKCERARQALNQLLTRNRLLVSDGQGGYRVMTTQERTERRRRLESDLRKHCR